MTKKEMAQAIANQTGLSLLEARAVIQRVFDAIVDTLVAEGRIELRDFGIFEVHLRRARRARNPRTGQAVQVAARNVVRFKAGKELADRLAAVADGAASTGEKNSAPRGIRVDPTPSVHQAAGVQGS
jgi:nucleoid DNA-binding protein